jgi:hypothetical protein
LLLTGLKALAQCSQFWRGAAVYAPLFLGNTDCGGSIGSFGGAGRSKLTPYLPPHSAASSIQHTYRLHIIERNCCLLPHLCGPYTSRPGCPYFTDEFAAKQNAYYCVQLAITYTKWEFPNLISYLTVLRGRDRDMQPPYSTNWTSFYRESCAHIPC